MEMDAPFLLRTLQERGARLSVRSGREGQPILVVAPPGIVGDLAGDVARFKPELMALVGAETCSLEAGQHRHPPPVVPESPNHLPPVAGVEKELEDKVSRTAVLAAAWRRLQAQPVEEMVVLKERSVRKKTPVAKGTAVPEQVVALPEELLLLPACPVALLRQVRNEGASVRFDRTTGSAVLVWSLPRQWSRARQEQVEKRLEQHSKTLKKRLVFEAWHWRTFVPHFALGSDGGGEPVRGVPRWFFYLSWQQFMRVHCAKPSPDDEQYLAHLVLDCQTGVARFDHGRIRNVWPVAEQLAGRELDGHALAEWARQVIATTARP